MSSGSADRPHRARPDWLSLRVRDPNRTLLRRGLRIAVLVPIVFFTFDQVLGMKPAALPAAFATFSILAFADLGGPPLDRLRANLILGAVGVVLIALGTLLNAPAWVAVVSTFVIVFVIAFASVLRGYFAASSTAAIVPWVIAITAPPGLTELPHKCLGWAVGAVVAAAGAALLWPSHPRSALRSRLAESIEAAANLVTELVADPASGATAEAWKKVSASIQAAHSAYDGRLVRPGVGTSRDRSLMLAFDQLHRLRTVLHVWVDTPTARLRQSDEQLAIAMATTLRDCATSLRAGFGITGASALGAARESHQDELFAWAEANADRMSPQEFTGDVEATFHLRVASLTAQVLAVYVQGALDSRDKHVGRRALGEAQTPITFAGEQVFDPDRSVSAIRLLRAQFNVRSPWFRTAVRTAIALGLTVLVVQLTGAQYGFWVSLGALVALKIDVSGTQRSALQVLGGTIVGFVIATVLVWLIADHVEVYWILLPFMAFLAAYTPGAISLAVGQASFTCFILMLFGIVHPKLLTTGVVRLTDVAVGLAISLVVSALIWPRGVSPAVRRTLHESAAASGAFLVAAFARLVEGPVAQEGVEAAREDANRSLSVANETFDLALTQAGRHQLESVPLWTTVLNCTSQLTFAAGVVALLQRIAPLPEEAAASGDAMLALAHHVQAEMARSTEYMAGEPPPAIVGGKSATASLVRLRELVAEDIARIWREEPRAGTGLQAIVLIYAQAWLAQSVWLAQRVDERLVEVAKEPATV